MMAMLIKIIIKIIIGESSLQLSTPILPTLVVEVTSGHDCRRDPWLLGKRKYYQMNKAFIGRGVVEQRTNY